MNILIKLTCLIGLVVAPILGGHEEDSHLEKSKENTIEHVTEDNSEKEESSIILD